MSKQLIVRKDNVLINASYTLTLAEQRLILIAVALAQSKPLEAHNVITADQYSEQFKVTRQTSYEALRDAVTQLFERRFSYQEQTKKGVKQIHSRWVSKIAYLEGAAQVELTFSSDVLPLLVDLKSRFTYFSLSQVSDLTSVYAIRLYELLIAWRSTGKTPIFEISDFREKLGVTETEYPRMTNFKTRVLNVALNQINEHTDLLVEFDQHKRGRSITGFSFTFKLKNSAVQAFEANKSKSKRKVISKAEAEALARPGESWTELLDRLKGEYWIKDLKPKKPEDPEA